MPELKNDKTLAWRRDVVLRSYCQQRGYGKGIGLGRERFCFHEEYSGKWFDYVTKEGHTSKCTWAASTVLDVLKKITYRN